MLKRQANVTPSFLISLVASIAFSVTAGVMVAAFVGPVVVAEQSQANIDGATQ